MSETATVSPTDMVKTDRENQPENYNLVAREREAERIVKDSTEKRDIGLPEAVTKAADAGGASADDPKNHKEKSETIKLPKGFALQAREGVTLILTKETEVEVLGARSKAAIAGELAAYPELYGAVRQSLEHTTTEDLGNGQTVTRKIGFGAHGIQQILEEKITTNAGTVDTTPAPGDTTANQAPLDPASTVARAEGAQAAQDKKTAQKTANKQAADNSTKNAVTADGKEAGAKTASDAKKDAAKDAAKQTADNEHKLAKEANDAKSPAADKAKGKK